MVAQNEFIEEVRFRCSPIAVLPLIFIFIVMLVLALYNSYKYDFAVQYIDLYPVIGKEIYLPIPIFFIIPLLFLGYIIHILYDAVYVIGEDYVRATYGLLSLSKKDIRLEFLDIRGIEVDRGIYGRIVNTGTIHVGTAMKEDEELFLINVYDPSKYRDMIIKRRNILQKEYKTQFLD